MRAQRLRLERHQRRSTNGTELFACHSKDGCGRVFASLRPRATEWLFAGR
jgi:hypothetical protein